jgi:hypothetical protein
VRDVYSDRTGSGSYYSNLIGVNYAQLSEALKGNHLLQDPLGNTEGKTEGNTEGNTSAGGGISHSNPPIPCNGRNSNPIPCNGGISNSNPIPCNNTELGAASTALGGGSNPPGDNRNSNLPGGDNRNSNLPGGCNASNPSNSSNPTESSSSTHNSIPGFANNNSPDLLLSQSGYLDEFAATLIGSNALSGGLSGVGDSIGDSSNINTSNNNSSTHCGQALNGITQSFGDSPILVAKSVGNAERGGYYYQVVPLDLDI